jgi:hypothetical protein
MKSVERARPAVLDERQLDMEIPPDSPLATGWRRELLAIVRAVGVGDALDTISVFAEHERSGRWANPPYCTGGDGTNGRSGGSAAAAVVLARPAGAAASPTLKR